jgi:hypothetical protein
LSQFRLESGFPGHETKRWSLSVAVEMVASMSASKPLGSTTKMMTVRIEVKLKSLRRPLFWYTSRRWFSFFEDIAAVRFTSPWFPWSDQPVKRALFFKRG